MKIPTGPIYRPTGAAAEYAEYALNLYGGCPHGCKYCYVPGVLRKTREEFHLTSTFREDIIIKLNAQLDRMAKTNTIPKEVFLCFTCDPWRKGCSNATTKVAMCVLNRYGISVNTLTKGGVVDVDFSTYSPGDKFGISISGDESLEPNAAPEASRVAALVQAKHTGLYTWISFEPIMDMRRVENIIPYVMPYVDEFRFGIRRDDKGFCKKSPTFRYVMQTIGGNIQAEGKVCVFKKSLEGVI